MCTSLDDAKGILEDEMGICRNCHDYKPCGCEPEDDFSSDYFDFNDEKRRSEGE